MEPSALHSQIALFDVEDDCLFFALGLAHAAFKVNQVLENQAGPPAENEDNLVYFILGLQSFSDHYLHALAGFDAGPFQGPEPPQPSNGESLPRLAIRDLLI